MKSVEEEFPLIEDITKAVRAVFCIRVVVALQTADAFSVATPVDWRPGDDVIVPTAASCGAAKDRMENRKDMTCYDK